MRNVVTKISSKRNVTLLIYSLRVQCFKRIFVKFIVAKCRGLLRLCMWTREVSTSSGTGCSDSAVFVKCPTDDEKIKNSFERLQLDEFLF